MKRVAIILIAVLFSCKEESVAKVEPIIALDIQHQMMQRLGNPELPPPPPIGMYYSNHNFIMDEDGNCHYYRLNCTLPICSKGMTIDSLCRPEFKGLDPSKMVLVSKNNLYSFFRKTVKPEYGKASFTIACVKDTFTSVSLSRIIEEVKSDTIDWRYIARKTTEEEEVVMRFLKSGDDYNPSKIQWDTTKVILPDYMKN